MDWESDAPTLLTLHTAKGLEFDTVFIVGMEEGICPHSRSMDDPNAMEEERRLCYVGMTRAKRHLYLVRTFRRTLYGSSDVREASRFLQDIPSHLIAGHSVRPSLSEQRGASPPSASGQGPLSRRRDGFRSPVRQMREEGRVSRRISRSMRREEPVADLSLEDLPPAREAEFMAGETVMHPVFGTGTVIESKVIGDDEEVTVAFEGRGIKRLMASYAKLQKG